MFFNANLETTFREWHCQFTSEGFLLNMNATRLTNVRYADDVILFGETFLEIIRTAELLVQEFARVGLELNTSRS